MASVEKAIFARLSGDPATTAIVGTRIYPVVMPANSTFPCVTFARTQTTKPPVLNGIVDLSVALVTIDVWSKEGPGSGQGWAAVSEASKTVRTALDGFRGTVGGVAVQGVTFLSEGTAYEEDVEVYRINQLYRVFFVDP